MRIIVAGSRGFNNYKYLKERIDALLLYLYEKDLIHTDSMENWDLEFVVGGAKGADTLAENFAYQHGFEFRVFLANWDADGKSAGFKRNALMANYASEDKNSVLLAFWDEISNGTKHMIETANKKGLTVYVDKYLKNPKYQIHGTLEDYHKKM